MLDRHLSFIEKLWKRININRVSRMNQHYVAIRSEIYVTNAKEKNELAYFKNRFEEYHRRTQRLLAWRYLFYIFLYAGLLVNYFKTVPWLAFLVEFIQLGSAVIGTTVIFGIVLLITVKINLHIELMNESLTHLIALYHKSDQRDTEKFLKALSKTL